jgi:serine/threonine-protein phosphatase 5
VIKKNPKDAVAKARFEECNKIVKRDAFLKAIEISDAPSAAEGLDVDSMAVDKDYDGVALDKETGMTQEFIDDMIQRFQNQKLLHKKYVFMIILKVMELVHAEPTMVETEVAEGTQLTVCGDTHGSLLYYYILNCYTN